MTELFAFPPAGKNEEGVKPQQSLPKCHTHTQTFISLVYKSLPGLHQLPCVIPMLEGAQGALAHGLKLLSPAGSQSHPAPYRKGNCSITPFQINKAKCTQVREMCCGSSCFIPLQCRNLENTIRCLNLLSSDQTASDALSPYPDWKAKGRFL